MKLTSAQWQVLFPYPHVLDPDGWDRKNFDHSWWEEQLTYEEYQSRLVRSTTAFHGYPEPLLKRLKTQIGQLLGEATMAWKPRPTGVFKTEEATKVLDKIMQMVEAGITFEEQTVKELPLEIQMTGYLDSLDITSDNIGDIRRSLFMPFDCQWNSWVRDETAKREKSIEQPNYTSKAKIEITL